MAWLTALLGAAGGYGAGRQQALQNKQTQEQIDAQNAYEQEQIALDKQKQKMAEDVYQRSTGIDPATGKPVQLPPALLHVTPGKNAGKPATDQQEIDHLYAVANNYIQRGFPDLAAPYLDRAKGLEGIIKQGQQNALILGRQETMADYRNQLPLNQWQQYQQGINQQYGVPGMREPWGYRFISPYQQFEEQQKLEHPNGKAATPEQIDNAGSQWYGKWAALTKPGQTALGIPTPPLIPNDQAAKAGKLFSMIDNDPNPSKKAEQLAGAVSNPNIKKMIILRGRWAQMKRDAATQPSSLGAPAGGSNDGGPPLYRPY